MQQNVYPHTQTPFHTPEVCNYFTLKNSKHKFFSSRAKTKQSEKECTLYLKYASVMIALVYNENYIFLLKLHFL